MGCVMLSIRYLSLSLLVLLVSPTAEAQIAGTPSGAARLGPVDASALGVTRAASVGSSIIESEWLVHGGFGFAGGSLRALFGRSSSEWSAGAAYARTLAGSEVIKGLHGTIGGELIGGFRYNRYGPSHDDGGLHLTIPAALTFGDPNRPLIEGATLALYVAPYAELGSAYSYLPRQCAPPAPCSNSYDIRHDLAAFATGFGVGTRASFGRFALDLMMRDAIARKRVGYNTLQAGAFSLTGRDLTLGFDYRFGK